MLHSQGDTDVGKKDGAKLRTRFYFSLFAVETKPVSEQALDKLLAVKQIKAKDHFTADELAFIVKLDPAHISDERKSRPNSPGSFAAMPQYSEAQLVVTHKLNCLADLLTRISPNKTTVLEALNQLNHKLQWVLKAYITAKEMELKARVPM